MLRMILVQRILELAFFVVIFSICEVIKTFLDLLLYVLFSFSIYHDRLTVLLKKPQCITVDHLHYLILFAEHPHFEAVFYQVFHNQGIPKVKNLLGPNYA
jgi:hypothetical protein